MVLALLLFCCLRGGGESGGGGGAGGGAGGGGGRQLNVTVKSASKLPNVETGRESDPFAVLTFRGVQRKTNHIENSCNPTWNEVSLQSLQYAQWLYYRSGVF